MARVFGAELLGPAGFRKQVAVKVIKSEMLEAARTEEVEAFIREARLGGLLKHPNIVDVYELGDEDGQLFLAMELVSGLTLHKVIRSGAVPPPSVVLEIAVGVVAGLASAHSLRSQGLKAGLVHRDLKPSNVLVSWNGAVKVADFGIATTRYGDLANEGSAQTYGRGTPSYMSPEQLLRHDVDGRSDLFAFGLVLTELIQAQLLPRNVLYDRLMQGLDRAVQIVPDDAIAAIDTHVPGLGSVVARCIEPYPETRYASAGALLSDLEMLRDEVGLQPPLRSWLAASHMPAFVESGQEENDAQTRFRTDVSTNRVAADTLAFTPSPVSRTNVGPALDGFVGRVAELEALHEQFVSGELFVTVKGAGGAGKTRFARKYARAQAEGLEGGAWFVDLTETRTPKCVVLATARVLNLTVRGLELADMVEELAEAIDSRGQALFVFDNFEQVAEHAQETVGRWRALTRSARFLVTSRQPLLLRGERVFSLEPLPHQESVELFIERSRSAGARWTNSVENDRAIAAIVAKLDGLPLAIELAAARARLLNPAQILERLAQRFDLLTRGGREAGGRQSGLRALIDWSWELLEPWEQAGLVQLSVFRDGFFMEAGEFVLDLSEWPESPWSLDVIGALLDKSLLHSAEVRGQPRFTMLGSVQEYVVGKDVETRASAFGRLAAYFSRFGTQEYRDGLDAEGGVERRRLLGMESGNLLTGVEVGLDTGERDVAALCALAAGELFKLDGPLVDGIALFDRILSGALDDEMRFSVLEKNAWLYKSAGRPAEALAIYDEALSIAREHGDRFRYGKVLGSVAETERAQGNASRALELFLQSLALVRELGMSRVEGVILGNLGMLYEGQGRDQDALDSYQAALDIHRQFGKLRLEGSVYANRANLLCRQGKHVESLDSYRRALEIVREVGDRSRESLVLGNLGNSYALLGQTDLAHENYLASIRLAREVGNFFTEMVSLGNQGDLFYLEEDFDRAEAQFLEVITRTERVYPLLCGVFRGSLALIYAKKKDYEGAVALLEAGEEQIRTAQEQFELGKFLCKKSEALFRRGDLNGALVAFEEASDIAVALSGAPESELNVAVDVAKQMFAAR